MKGSSVAECEGPVAFGTRNGGQHSGVLGCLIGMKRKQVEFNHATAKARRIPEQPEASVEKDVYDLSTPLWHKYYEAVRKSIRFPRYYKHDLNW